VATCWQGTWAFRPCVSRNTCVDFSYYHEYPCERAYFHSTQNILAAKSFFAIMMRYLAYLKQYRLSCQCYWVVKSATCCAFFSKIMAIWVPQFNHTDCHLSVLLSNAINENRVYNHMSECIIHIIQALLGPKLSQDITNLPIDKPKHQAYNFPPCQQCIQALVKELMGPV
jgi:hypothetical protein